MRFFTARTGSASEAEDIVQELWVRISEGDVGPVGAPTAYLYRAGLNLAADRSRERRRRGQREANWVDVAVDQSGDGGLAIDETPSPFRQAAANARLQQIAAAIAALPEGAQRVFRMHRLEGLGHSVIAAQLGISRSAVEKHMAVAMRHLAAARLRETD
jgi:RNA polymerase sigma-70 factor (ECF subfamily)